MNLKKAAQRMETIIDRELRDLREICKWLNDIPDSFTFVKSLLAKEGKRKMEILLPVESLIIAQQSELYSQLTETLKRNYEKPIS